VTIVEAPTAGIITYNLDAAHSSARFSVRYMMISNVHGGFSDISGHLDFDPANPTFSRVKVEIGVGSINTGQEQRDSHLRTADFFHADHFPTITFESTVIEQTGPEAGKLIGDLSIRGVTKLVSLDFEGSAAEVKDRMGMYRLGFSSHTRIKRSEFGLIYNAPLDSGGVLIGDEVDITIEAQFVRQGI
jgi:polyisoprenoid-binding protein YceI